MIARLSSNADIEVGQRYVHLPAGTEMDVTVLHAGCKGCEMYKRIVRGEMRGNVVVEHTHGRP